MELARKTGISPPTVSKLAGSLLKARLLEEGDSPETALGRPARVLRLAGERVCVLAVVLDTNECHLAAAGLDGRLRHDEAVAFRTPHDYGQLLKTLVAEARRLLRAQNKTTPLALGLSIPGLLDRHRGQVLLSAHLHLLDGRFPAADLQKRLDIPVILLHDTDALCIGERAFGQVQGMDDLVLIDATAGVGAAVMVDGHLMAGHSGLAGEIGHLTVEPHGRPCGCGNIGCLETVASDAALAARVSQKIGKTVDIPQIVDLARQGKIDVDAELRDAIEYLAIGIAGVVNIFNPAAVLVHAAMFDIQDGIFDRLKEAVGRRSLPPALAECKIIRAIGGKLPSAIAATIHHLTSALGPKV